MSVRLKWDGLRLFLGRTEMAHLESIGSLTTYVLGPKDYTSKPYESSDDCRQGAEAHVRRLLAKAGAPDA